MYPLISVFIIVVGALLLIFANKIIKNNKVNRIGIKAVSYTHLDVYKRQKEDSVNENHLSPDCAALASAAVPIICLLYTSRCV